MEKIKNQFVKDINILTTEEMFHVYDIKENKREFEEDLFNKLKNFYD